MSKEKHKLTSRKIYLNSGATHKKDVTERIIKEFCGENSWGGSLTEASKALFPNDEAAGRVVDFLDALISHEPLGLAQFTNAIREQTLISPDKDAIWKVGLGMIAIATLLSDWQEFRAVNNGKIHAETSLAMDTMVAFIRDEHILNKIEKSQNEEEIRDLIHQAVISRQIVFRNKATSETIEEYISEMKISAGVLDETVVKGVGIVSGVGEKHQLTLTDIHASAYLSVHRIDHKKDEELASLMRKNGFNVSAGCPTQDAMKYLTPIYQGHLVDLKDSQEKYESDKGMPRSSIQKVVRRVDADIRRILDIHGIDFAKNALVVPKSGVVTRAAYRIAYFLDSLKDKHEEIPLESYMIGGK